MKITGDELITMFYTSMTDDKMVEILDELGLEQPLLDEEYDFYKTVSTKDKHDIGIDLTFSELNECTEVGIPCMDVISWDNDKKVSLPFHLSTSLSYDECCQVLGKKADYTSNLIEELRTWIIEKNNNKYLVNIDFKTTELIEIIGIIISPFTIEKIDDTYVPNQD